MTEELNNDWEEADFGRSVVKLPIVDGLLGCAKPGSNIFLK